MIQMSHTKPIENYYVNFDRELKKAGAPGFNKTSDNIIIKYSKNHIGKKHQWRTKGNRKTVQKLEVQEREFNEKPNQFITLGIDEDAVKILRL